MAIADDQSAFNINPAGISRNSEYRRLYLNSRIYNDFKHWGLNAALIDGITEEPIQWGFLFDTTRTLAIKKEQYVFASSYNWKNYVLIGTTAKFTQFNRSLNYTPTWLFATDAGLLFFPTDYLSFGATLKNFIRSKTRSSLAPVFYGAGIAINLQKLRADLDIERNESDKESVFRGGVEFFLTPSVLIRGGYYQDRKRVDSGVTVGASAQNDRVGFDIGFLDAIHSDYKVFSMGISVTL
ncbi:MAG: hypothetical protein JWQ35_1882 [Bacteriovoracaceae bacterium]|nr:hypothetical protein [Bacteriovoracaceae bacterium]